MTFPLPEASTPVVELSLSPHALSSLAGSPPEGGLPARPAALQGIDPTEPGTNSEKSAQPP